MPFIQRLHPESPLSSGGNVSSHLREGDSPLRPCRHSPDVTHTQASALLTHHSCFGGSRWKRSRTDGKGIKNGGGVTHHSARWSLRAETSVEVLWFHQPRLRSVRLGAPSHILWYAEVPPPIPPLSTDTFPPAAGGLCVAQKKLLHCLKKAAEVLRVASDPGQTARLTIQGQSVADQESEELLLSDCCDPVNNCQLPLNHPSVEYLTLSTVLFCNTITRTSCVIMEMCNSQCCHEVHV